MKRLTWALALALTVSLTMSSVVSASTLKPKNEQKPAQSTSASNKADDSTVGKTMTIMQKKIVPDKNSQWPKAIDSKTGTETIVLTNVTAVKKETLALWVKDNDRERSAAVPRPMKSSTKKVTIYEIPVGAKIITSSANKTGTARAPTMMFAKRVDGKTYEVRGIGGWELGETITTEEQADGNLLSVSIVDEIQVDPGYFEDDAPVFIRVVPAK